MSALVKAAITVAVLYGLVLAIVFGRGAVEYLLYLGVFVVGFALLLVLRSRRVESRSGSSADT